MGVTAKDIKVGTQLPPLVKHITLQKMIWFSGTEDGGEAKSNHHTDPKVAMENDGMPVPYASGRMSVGYVAEAIGRYVGIDVFDHHGTADVRLRKPVIAGDTITIKAHVTEVIPEGNAVRVNFGAVCENQKGDLTAVGGGSVLLPK